MLSPTTATADDLLAYWGAQAARGVDGLPDDRAFDAFGLRPWLGRVSVYRALPGGADFLLRLEGTEIVAITGEDWTGHRASEIDAHYRGRLLVDLLRVAAGRQPLVDEIRIFQKSFIRIKRLLLPIGRDGQVTKVLLCFFPRDDAMAMPFVPKASRSPAAGPTPSSFQPV